jgi:hypothetical protein
MPDLTSEPSNQERRLDDLPNAFAADGDRAWWADMTAWTDARLGELGIRRIRPLVPIRVWVRSAVASFETDRGRMWAKAVPEVFSHEVALTELLADIDPGAVPPVVAAERERGRMITDHVEGPLLTAVGEPVAWTATLARMAELQRVLSNDRDALEIAGVAAAPLDGLAARIPVLIADDRLLAVGRPSGLSEAEAGTLRARAQELIDACLALAASPVPDSLDHGDLRPSQVIVGPMGPVILDWSDGSITHPFLAAASFLADVGASSGVVPVSVDALADAYIGPWLEPTGLSAGAARGLLDLARTVHPLHVAAQYADRVLPALERRADLAGVVPDRLRSLP